jgi:hypothetical protein
MNNAFVNGFAASVVSAAGLWSVERPRTAAAMGFHAPATPAVANHVATAQAIARPVIPVHT